MNDAEAYKLLEEQLSPDAFALVKGLLSEMEAQLSDAMIDVARKAAAKEREACAKVAEDVAKRSERDGKAYKLGAWDDYADKASARTANSIASLIRGRGET